MLTTQTIPLQVIEDVSDIFIFVTNNSQIGQININLNMKKKNAVSKTS